MWIEKQSNGKLRYVERIKDPYTGKRRRVYEQVEKNTPQAKKKAAVALQMQINDILNTKPTNDEITFGQVYKDFYEEWALGVKKSTAYSTTHIDKLICEKIPADYKIVKIDRRFLQKLFNQLLVDGRSHNYVKKVKWKLNQIFKYALRMDYISTNEMINVEIPKEILTPEKLHKKKTKFLDKQEFQLFIQNLKEETYCDYRVKRYLRIAIVLYMTGMRYGELSGINPETDIDFENRKIHIRYNYDFRSKERTIPKTMTSDRTIDVPKIVITLIKEQLVENIRNGFGTDYIFINTKGLPITPGRVIGAMKRHGKKAGIEKNITTHTFRHSHISLLAEMGIPLRAIMERVGHSDSKTTLEIYNHVTVQMTLDLSNKLDKVKVF